MSEREKTRDGSTLFVLLMLVLSVVSLFVENGMVQNSLTRTLVTVLDYLIFLLFIYEMVARFARAPYKLLFLRQNALEVAFLVIFTSLFITNRYVAYLVDIRRLQKLSVYLIILRNVFIFIKIFGRMRKLGAVLRRIADRPSQTVLTSFAIVIVVGTLLLMMPFATSDGSRLGMVNALFTSTSAVCVTGLIVVDTATRFSLLGKLVILFLIQIGGLGIMILSYFMMFLFRRKISVERRLIMSYMLDDSDMTQLYSSIRDIIRLTLAIEIVGFLFLFLSFSMHGGAREEMLLDAVFHSVSAFCNAGFALFSHNLENFRSNLPLNLTVAALIILGGLGFSVLSNLFEGVRQGLGRIVTGRRAQRFELSLNSKVVLLTSGVLILAGTLLFYGFEHGGSMREYGTGTQYLASFFQSVTLRTAGFNTVPFGNLNRYSYLFMIVFMLIGGASGSTAGGVKVNTVAVIAGYVKSIIDNRNEVTIFNKTIADDLVNRAFLILLLYSILIFLGVTVLSMTEGTDILRIGFEVVSALGTVGLSAGVTGGLTTAGKATITALMFVGRLGPLTVFIALSQRKKKRSVGYPQGSISIG
jgi:trk system potassium uptake protein TrkH